MAVFSLVGILIFAALPLAVACLAYFRRWRRLAQMGLVVCTLALLGELSQLVHGWTHNPVMALPGHGTGWQDLGFLLLMVAPWWLTALFWKHAVRMVDRYLPELPPTEAQTVRALRWEQRMQPVRRGALRAALAGAELLVWAAVLGFIGTMAWLWQASGGLDGAGDAGRDAFGTGAALLVGCLLVFLVSLMVRSDCRTQLRAISAAHD